MSTKNTTRKTVFALAVAVLALCAVPALSGATVLFSDQFNYANGNLTAAVGTPAGWYAHSGAAAKPIQVLGGAIVVQQSTGSGEDDNHPFPQQAAGATTYSSITLKVPVGSVMGSANDYFYHFRPAGTDSNNFVARTWIGPPTAGGNYRLGIAAGSLTTTPVVPWTSDLTFGVTYRIVISWNDATGAATLWVNPTQESDPSVTSTSAPLAGRLLASIAVRQAAPTGATDSQIIDDLGVGTTFADAITAHQSLPGVSPWGLVILASMLVAVGAFFALRRREATA